MQTQPPPQAPAEDRIPLKGLRREIAEHMQTAMREAPQVTSMDLFDATEIVKARDVLSKSAEAEGVKLTYLPFFVKACIAALKAASFFFEGRWKPLTLRTNCIAAASISSGVATMSA